MSNFEKYAGEAFNKALLSSVKIDNFLDMNKMITLDDLQQKIEYGKFKFTDDEYREIKAINSSSIKQGDKDIIYMDYSLSGYSLNEKSKSLDIGSMFHFYLLEEEQFNKLYYFSDRHIDGRSKKEIANEMLKNGYKIRIDLKDAEIIKRMKDSALKNQYVEKLLNKPGECEQTILWKNADYNLNCKMKADKIISDNPILLDIKTSKESSEKSFRSDFNKFGYNIQASFYKDGFEQFTGSKLEYFFFIVFGKNFPYICNIYEVSIATLAKSKDDYYKIIKNYIDYKNDPSIIKTRVYTL